MGVTAKSKTLIEFMPAIAAKSQQNRTISEIVDNEMY